MARVLTSYYRPDRGGLFKRLLRAMRALAEAGHTVHYLAVEPFDIQHSRIVFHRFPWPKNSRHGLLFWGFFHLFAPVLLAFLAWHWKINHAFGFSPTYAFLLKPAGTLWRIHLTCFVHGDAILAHRLKGRPEWLIRMEQWIEGRAIRRLKLVALQPHLIRMLVDRHPGISATCYDLLPNDLPHVFAEKSGQIRHPLQVAMIGTLDPRKNHRLVLDILSSIPPGRFELHIYGVGSLERALKAIVTTRKLQDSIFFHGWVPADKIWPHVDVLLMPSLQEGMPEVVLEAIAHRIPVLASDIPAHCELLPPEYLLPLGEPSRWVDALERLLVDMEQIRYRQRSYTDRFSFDWDRRIVEMIVAEV
jgi:glycosyltransferase involved in cell wall biosynthesis